MTIESAERHATATTLWRMRLSLFAARAHRNWDLFVRGKTGLIGLAIIGLYVVIAFAHPVAGAFWNPAIYDPVTGYAFDETRQPAPPSLRHPLGTDSLGRDVLSQLSRSARSEFLLGVVSALVTVFIATTVAAVSAYFGGAVDALLMRVADIMIMMPVISVLVVLSGFLQVGVLELGLIIGVLGGFGATAIVLKSHALTIMVRPYIEVAQAAGAGDRHIIFSHIMPALLPLSFLFMMFTVTSAIFAEAALSFLGLLNVNMSWGIMLHNTQASGYLLRVDEFWWLVLPASLSVTLLSSSFYLVGRAMDEVFNPKLRRA